MFVIYLLLQIKSMNACKLTLRDINFLRYKIEDSIFIKFNDAVKIGKCRVYKRKIKLLLNCAIDTTCSFITL